MSIVIVLVFTGLTIRLWDLETGQELRCFTGHTDIVYCLAFSRDGRRFLSGGHDKTVRLWDVNSGQELRRSGFLGVQVVPMSDATRLARDVPGGVGVLVQTLVSLVDSGLVIVMRPGRTIS